MKSKIYMNHKIRDKTNVDSKTPEPVITIETGKTRIFCNSVEIDGKVVVRFGKLDAIGHHVRAWIECDPNDIRKIL